MQGVECICKICRVRLESCLCIGLREYMAIVDSRARFVRSFDGVPLHSLMILSNDIALSCCITPAPTSDPYPSIAGEYRAP